MKKITAIIFAVLLVLLSPASQIQARVETDTEGGYTYTYDVMNEVRRSPNAYSPQKMWTGDEFGIGNFNDPESLFVRGNDLYVCDTGNNRIVVLTYQDKKFELKEVITEVTGDTEITTFSEPYDIYVMESGDRYICDRQNQRILHTNAKNEVIKEITKPKDETIADDALFLPTKVIVDVSGRVIALIESYNQGFLQFDAEGQFMGYLGANKVKYNITDYIWKMISTQAQREQMEQFIPTEYANLSFDRDGFVYAITSVFDPAEAMSGAAKPIRKLNTLGEDILVRNGNSQPIGDLIWGRAGDIMDCSRFTDITVLDNDVYYALDKTRGKIFGYDYQGNLLYAFGGVGNYLGKFKSVISIEHMGSDLFVLDNLTGGITNFVLTEFGTLINEGLSEYMQGNYKKSGEYWNEVLKYNGNYDMAYIGIGRSLLREGEYKEAMMYFESKWDSANYSKAFKLYRKEWIEDNITWIIGVIVLLTAFHIIKGMIKKIKVGWSND